MACGGQARLCTWFQAGNQLDACCGTASTLRSATTQMRPNSRVCMGKQISKVHRWSLSKRFEVQFRKEFALEPVVMPKPSFGLPSNVRVDIFCGVMRVAGDPDANTLEDWLVQGAPLGMDRRIETTGVFPPADKPDKEDHSPTPDVSEQLTVGWGHYGSVLENPVDAHKDFEMYRAARTAVDIDKDHARASLSERSREQVRTHCQGIARKAQIAPGRGYETSQGKRTSGGARAPGLVLLSEAASLGFTTNAGVSCENVTCDFSDACCHVLVHHCLVAAPPSPYGSDQNIALMCRMGFGSKGAPLTWCRIAAALGRVAQAMLMGARWSGHAASRVNTNIDDPLHNLLGTQTQ